MFAQWVARYPYGAHDTTLCRYLRSQGCAVGLATDAAVADLAEDDSLSLPRLDTNDVPLGEEG